MRCIPQPSSVSPFTAHGFNLTNAYALVVCWLYYSLDSLDVGHLGRLAGYVLERLKSSERWICGCNQRYVLF